MVQSVWDKRRKWQQDEFESLEDLLAFCVAGDAAWQWNKEANAREPSRGRERREWQGTATFPEALRLAREGWPEGRSKMVSGLNAAGLIQVQDYGRGMVFDVAGAFPMVSLAVAGEPANMVQIGDDERRSRPIIRLMVNTSYTSDVTAQQITNRGAAILSWVDKLENEGARCEIVILRSTEVAWGDKCRYSGLFTLKRADEPLDIDRAAFVIAHAAMLRRIWFSVMDRHATLDNKHIRNGSFRSSDFMPQAWKMPHTVYFPCLREDRRPETQGASYETTAQAVQVVGGVIRKALAQEQAQEAEAEQGEDEDE